MMQQSRKAIFIYRRYLTLIEIMIVIMILSLITGVVGINVMRALKGQRFRTEVDLMVDTLRTAQDVMLILGADAHVRVKTAENGKGLEYMLDIEDGVPKQWKAVIARPPRLLIETHGITFKELNPFPVVDGQLDIRFQSEGTGMSRGVVRMSTHENENAPGAITYAICLKGYPYPISAEMVTKDNPVECPVEESADYDSRLTLYTIQEVIEDNALKGVSEQPQEDKAPENGTQDEKTIP